MTIQNYLIIESNVVTNIVVWDGNTDTWQPPVNSIQIIQSTTPAMVWGTSVISQLITDWILVEQIGAASVGFTWNDGVCITNEPKPEPIIQPTSTGTQNA